MLTAGTSDQPPCGLDECGPSFLFNSLMSSWVVGLCHETLVFSRQLGRHVSTGRCHVTLMVLEELESSVEAGGGLSTAVDLRS